MSAQKFSGILKEILASCPNLDVSDYLEIELGLPRFKAELLAKRIEGNYLQKLPQKTKSPVQRLFEPQTGELPKAYGYHVNCLSEKEFKRFICWVLEESGYMLQPEKPTNGWGFETVSEKANQKVAIQVVIRVPYGFTVSEHIIALTEAHMKKTDCTKAVIIASGYFNEKFTQKAQEANIELWNQTTLNEKIRQAEKNCKAQAQAHFPPYQGNLFDSLLKLEDDKEFLVELKAQWRYEVLLPGVKYPLLTFQTRDGKVSRCVFRIKYNEPVTEAEGEVVVGSDETGNRVDPDEKEAYKLVTQYLEQFVE